MHFSSVNVYMNIKIKHFNLCTSYKHVDVLGIQHEINMEVILLNHWKIN